MGIMRRVANAFRSRRLNRDLDEELQFHLDARTQDNLAAGLPPEQARRDASLKFGNRTLMKERTRDMNVHAWIETTGQDLRYALRGLKRSPGFAATAILSLALGIGASVSIFTVADNLLLRPLPYPDASRLMILWEGNKTHNFKRNVVAPANYLDWKAQNDVFESMAVFQDGRTVLTDGSRADEFGALSASAELLPMLGVQPFRGRLFTPEDGRAAIKSDQIVLVSYRLWQTWFGGDEGIVGRTVQINSMPRTIVGVLPPGFSFELRDIDLWEPLGLDPAQNYRKTSGRYLLSIARLKPGVTQARAQVEMTGIASRLEAAYPAFNTNWSVQVESLRDALVQEVRPSLLALLCAVGLLLAVACANVANLLLARFTSRRQEMAVRASLGAGRWRVVRQLLTESVLLGLAGGILGIVFAKWAVTGMLALAPAQLTRSLSISMDLRILLFALGLSLFTGIVFGLAPALTTTRARSNARRWSLHGHLIGAEVALSVVLLVGAGLLFRTVLHLQAVDPGLNASGVLTFRVRLPAARYQGQSSTQFFERAIGRIEQLPGVRSASAVSYLPFDGGPAGTTVTIGGRPAARPGEEPSADIRTVMPGYFRTLGIPLKQGRDFTAADNAPGAPVRFIVSEAFVRKYLRGEDPLSKTISVYMAKDNPYSEIIGVAGDVKQDSLDKESAPAVYYVHTNLKYPNMVFAARVGGDPLALAGPVRRIIREMDPALPMAGVRTLDQIVGQTIARQRFAALLLVGFSLAALLLASVGIYGVLAYAVSERTREVGIRLAVGADPARIVTLILGSGARMAGVGTAIGVLGALALSYLLKSLLFGVSTRDPLTFVAVPLILMLIALMAAWLPARRASKIDPMQALRTQ
jgi:putative ABC transport system permease protein